MQVVMQPAREGNTAATVESSTRLSSALLSSAQKEAKAKAKAAQHSSSQLQRSISRSDDDKHSTLPAEEIRRRNGRRRRRVWSGLVRMDGWMDGGRRPGS
ncbi:uncharacterized protein K452DRAFT_47667 [Aplosporella prunicola CBS 121167]|uniref:Uncharacterized protein n=1 Tax=Aplosporella prunicola CBS 121167 TaxID=1176127 RepID=A0A6A6BAX6_9PEZI|nr:uncharacterized protein K452DRAFT_47667 [Aplosporella prunicola CBS 121167]KAF2140513.1 hypothetical protein K452DRAFT_47667 [Aplosporella prunicola CBS 121167]